MPLLKQSSDIVFQYRTLLLLLYVVLKYCILVLQSILHLYKSVIYKSVYNALCFLRFPERAYSRIFLSFLSRFLVPRLLPIEIFKICAYIKRERNTCDDDEYSNICLTNRGKMIKYQEIVNHEWCVGRRNDFFSKQSNYSTYVLASLSRGSNGTQVPLTDLKYVRRVAFSCQWDYC